MEKARRIGAVLSLTAALLMLMNVNPTTVSAYVMASTTFDTDLDGWSSTEPQINWVSTGGNPGGYLGFYDAVAGETWIQAPQKYLGDWSGLETGKISYDHKIIVAGVAEYFTPYKVEIYRSPTNYAVWEGETPSLQDEGVWNHIVAPLREEMWDVTGDWSELLQDVQYLWISVENVSNLTGPTEEAGIDNIELDTVPIHGAVWLLGSGFLGLVGLRKKLTNRSSEGRKLSC